MVELMMSTEHTIMSEVLLAAPKSGYTIWRNNVGMGWAGKSMRMPDGKLLLENPRPIHAGLCEGSSDLIGMKRVRITPEMVGQELAVFAAIEVKSAKGRVTKPQQHFLDFVKRAGGVAILARSADDLAAQSNSQTGGETDDRFERTQPS